MAAGLSITLLLLLLMNKERCGEEGARDEEEEEEARPGLVLSVQGLVLVASFNVPPPRRGLEGIDWLCVCNGREGGKRARGEMEAVRVIIISFSFSLASGGRVQWVQRAERQGTSSD